MKAFHVEITCYLVVRINKYTALHVNKKVKLTAVYCFSVFQETLVFNSKQGTKMCHLLFILHFVLLPIVFIFVT